MRRLSLLGSAVLSLSLVAGCGGLEADEGQGDNIQGGKADSGDPAVGLVWIASGGFCTGTLIAPQVVLTAAHCVTERVSMFYTGKGAASASVNEPKTSMVGHTVDKQAIYPNYKGGTCPNATGDVGLIHLAQPLTGIAAVSFATSNVSSVGKSCTAIGFGDHSGTYEAKRSATETVKAIAAAVLTVDQGSGIADHGDSGGPLVCGGKVAGATSCHTDGDYPAHKREYYARVDAFAPWIQQTMAGWR